MKRMHSYLISSQIVHTLVFVLLACHEALVVNVDHVAGNGEYRRQDCSFMLLANEINHQREATSGDFHFPRLL